MSRDENRDEGRVYIDSSSFSSPLFRNETGHFCLFVLFVPHARIQPIRQSSAFWLSAHRNAEPAGDRLRIECPWRCRWIRERLGPLAQVGRGLRIWLERRGRRYLSLNDRWRIVRLGLRGFLGGDRGGGDARRTPTM